MGEAFLLKQGQFVSRGRCVMCMHHWLRPLSFGLVYVIDEYLIKHILL